MLAFFLILCKGVGLCSLKKKNMTKMPSFLCFRKKKSYLEHRNVLEIRSNKLPFVSHRKFFSVATDQCIPGGSAVGEIGPQSQSAAGNVFWRQGKNDAVKGHGFLSFDPLQDFHFGRTGRRSALFSLSSCWFIQNFPLQPVRGKFVSGRGGGARTVQPGQPGRPIQPKGGLPDPKSKQPAMIVPPKNKKLNAANKSQASANPTTGANEQQTKITVTSTESTISKPVNVQTEKVEEKGECKTLPQQKEVASSTESTAPTQVSSVVTSEPTVNGTPVLTSSGTNGTMTVAEELEPVPKSEPMDVDKDEQGGDDEDDDEKMKIELKDEVEENKSKLKAVVKPHIITHIIDGFVIEEGSEPFPVSVVALDVHVCSDIQRQILRSVIDALL